MLFFYQRVDHCLGEQFAPLVPLGASAEQESFPQPGVQEPIFKALNWGCHWFFYILQDTFFSRSFVRGIGVKQTAEK
jgi:hypothetical protein